MYEILRKNTGGWPCILRKRAYQSYVEQNTETSYTEASHKELKQASAARMEGYIKEVLNL